MVLCAQEGVHSGNPEGGETGEIGKIARVFEASGARKDPRHLFLAPRRTPAPAHVRCGFKAVWSGVSGDRRGQLTAHVLSV